LPPPDICAAVFAENGANCHLTGPIQFRGYSLNKAELAEDIGVLTKPSSTRSLFAEPV